MKHDHLPTKQMKDVDEELINKLIDELFFDEIINPTQIKDNKSQQDMLKLVSRIYRSTNWQLLKYFPENRKKLCSQCLSVECDHLSWNTDVVMDGIINQANNNCYHDRDENWLFENSCIKCLIDACKDISIDNLPNNKILVLWDATDLCNYYNSLKSFDLDIEFTN